MVFRKSKTILNGAYLNGGIDSLTAWDSGDPVALKDLLCVLQYCLIAEF